MKSSKLEMSDKLIDRRFELNLFVGDDVGAPEIVLMLLMSL